MEGNVFILVDVDAGSVISVHEDMETAYRLATNFLKNGVGAIVYEREVL